VAFAFVEAAVPMGRPGPFRARRRCRKFAGIAVTYTNRCGQALLETGPGPAYLRATHQPISATATPATRSTK
jgi:hypothetical protein